MKAFILALAASVVLVGCVAVPTSSSTSTTSTPSAASKITLAQFQQVATGMTYEEVSGILGGPGEELSRSEIGGTVTVMYAWKNFDGSNMNAMFQGGKLISKAQFGLK